MFFGTRTYFLLLLTFIHPIHAYIYNIRTYERVLEDGTIQRLHVGADLHDLSALDKEHVEGFINHVLREQSYTLTESHSSYEGFLKLFPEAVIQHSMAHEDIEFRSIYWQGTDETPNSTTIHTMLERLESYAANFKENALQKNILTQEDFLPIAELRKNLAAHGHKTVDEFRKEKGPVEFAKIKDVGDKLIEDAALYKVCAAQQHDVCLAMGGWHIERQSFKYNEALSPQLITRFGQQGWHLVQASGGNSADPELTPINVAQHFECLPSVGKSRILSRYREENPFL